MSTYYIASLKHTHKHHEHIVWWGRMECGYTPVMGDYCGAYCYGYAVDLNDGVSCIAVPAHIVKMVQSPEPYYKPGGRFYDQRGPVVENTRHNWVHLIGLRLQPEVWQPKPKAEPFRGRRRAIYTADDVPAAA